MSNSVKSISVSYRPVNRQNIFSNGDVLAGRVVVEIAKETKIKTLLVKVRGKAEVSWTEQQGYRIDIYDAKEKCLRLDELILSPKKGEDDIILAPGSHTYPFTFKLPQRSLPSSFKGEHGSIKYNVEAKLSRSWRIPSRASALFTFLSKVDLRTQQLMSPQQGIVTKTYKVFTSGNVTLKVNLDKSSFQQGEKLKVRVEVNNGTSREIKPMFCVTQKQNFFANGRRKLDMKKVLKAVGKPIPAQSEQTHVDMINLPCDLSVSILNCNIIKVEYKLRVYLDVPYAINPELKMPIVILPTSHAPPSAAKPNQPGPVRASGATGSNKCKKNPLPTAPGAAHPSSQPLPIALMQQNSETCALPSSGAGIFPLQTDSLAPPPYSALNPQPPEGGPRMFQPLSAPEAPPPYTGFDPFPTLAAPGAPPPYWASGGPEPLPDPVPDAGQAASELYPSLSENEEKASFCWRLEAAGRKSLRSLRN